MRALCFSVPHYRGSPRIETLNMRGLIRKIIRYFAFEHGKWPGLYRRICQPSSIEYAAYLRRRGVFYSMGEHCQILTTTNFTDPAYVRLGNNVHFSNCAVIGHDGSIAMLNQAYNVKLESVGKIDIRDNVFIGYQAVVLPNVTIGPDAIVAAGSIVTKDVPPGTIVAGIPAKPIGRVADLVEKLKTDTENLPWAELIAKRSSDFDRSFEPELVRRRVAHFYPPDSTKS
jgi:acetyltransferase-like isoleucine patch superfamily enzyme